MARLNSDIQPNIRTKMHRITSGYMHMVARISQPHLLRPLESHIEISSMSVRLYADELFLTNAQIGAVRSISLRSGLLGVRDAFHISSEAGHLHGACYIPSIYSLLLCISEGGLSWLMALSHDGPEWSERARIPIASPTGHIWLLNVSTPTVLFAERGSSLLRIERITNEYAIETMGQINLSGKILAIDARADEKKDSLVVVAYENESIALYRLVDNTLCEFLRFEEPDVSSVLLLSDRLLAAIQPKYPTSDRNSQSIVELELNLESENENACSSQHRELLGRNEGIVVGCWCVAGQKVALWDFNSGDILLYSLR